MNPPPHPLSHAEYTKRVDEERYPDDPHVPLDEPFVNAAGSILNVLLERFTSVALIESHPGAVRANHYHKTDWHYAYVLSGSIVYGWRPVDGANGVQVRTFEAGQLFFTPPLVAHVMYFPERTTFMTFARNKRDHESHESDVVRVPPMFDLKWSSFAGRYEYTVDPGSPS